MAKLLKGKGKVHELTDMDIQFVSLVTAGANRQKKFLMVKTAKVVPDADADETIKKAAQGARSERHGIEILKDGNALSYPAGLPTIESMYGDPVNLKYPFGGDDNNDDLDITAKTLAGFKRDVESYTDERSRQVVYERIVRKALAAGVGVAYNNDDPVDVLLPQELKDTLLKSIDGGDGGNDDSGGDKLPAVDDSAAGDDPPDPDLGEWLDTAGGRVEDRLLEDALSAAKHYDTDNDDNTDIAAYRGDNGSVFKSSPDDGTGKLLGQVGRLERENVEVKASLEKALAGLRKAEVRAGKLRQGVIGGASRLMAGEVVSRDVPKATGEPIIKRSAWISGGDLANGKK